MPSFDTAAAPYWVGAGVALLLAIVAGLGERRRKRRADLDRISPVNWPSVQMFALIATAICLILALHS